MTESRVAHQMDEGNSSKSPLMSIKDIAVTILAIIFFLQGIDMLGTALEHFAGDRVAPFVEATSNPYMGLFIGLLVTAILQSSSTTTSIVVAAVATQSITLQNAIPIILGANIGTTITSTIVAFGYITKANEFKRAVAAAMVHDMFNIIGVLILFPLELKYGLLAKGSTFIASLMPLGAHASNSKFWITQAFDFISLGFLNVMGPLLLLVFSVLLLFASLKMLSNMLYKKYVGERKLQLQKAVFKNPIRAFGWGALTTAIVQSSSLTTSLIVPLVATNRVGLARAFQFVMGANIGTTITAILAALFRSEAAMSLAMAHFLFNFLVALIYVSIPFVGKLPVFLAEKLGYLMARYRVSAFIYITLAFFVIPFALIYFSRPEEAQPSPTIEQVKKIEEP